MHHDHFGEPAFALRAQDPSAHPVLAGVVAEGRVDGVLFTMTLRQTYRNAGERNLEVIYSFPLPAQAVLLGFAAELGGRRLEGATVPRAAAEQTYEQALADGDAPVLLEALPGGLHSASIGNLQPGEQIVLEVRFAQMLQFEQGRLRLVVPTTVAPRFGAPAADGLQPHQVPQAALDAEYPLVLAVTVGGSLAADRLDCPTHALTSHRADGALRVSLAPGARLDRDVVLVLTPAEPRPDLLVRGRDAASDDAPAVALAAFEMPPRPAREAVALRLLVDCSGSMAGDSIASARRALHAAVDALQPLDRVGYSRFGSTVVHECPLQRCTPAVAAALHRRIDATEADLGGTEIGGALRSLFEQPGADRADVLLITDGEAWGVEATVADALAGGHRVFAIGVGSAPAESVVRRIAEATGGACEFATPGEDLHAAVLRMLRRIRQQPSAGLRIDWGREPLWQTAMPASAFGGDTVSVFAGFAGGAPAAPVRLLALDARGAASEIARSRAEAHSAGDDLARLGAAARLPGLDGDAARALALRYRLPSEHTQLVLVHERAEADKPQQAAELHRVRSMLAAGWGGTGRVLAHEVVCSFEPPAPMVSHSARRHSAATFDLVQFSQPDAPAGGIERPPSQSPARERKPSPATLAQLVDMVARHLALGGQPHELPACGQPMGLAPPVRQVLAELHAIGIDEGLAWLLLALWSASRDGRDGDAHAAAALAVHAAGIDEGVRRRAGLLFEEFLAAFPADGWRSSRLRRLARAMGRAL